MVEYTRAFHLKVLLQEIIFHKIENYELPQSGRIIFKEKTV